MKLTEMWEAVNDAEHPFKIQRSSPGVNDIITRANSAMECYATPWPLWRESRNLWHFVKPSFIE